MPTEYSPVAELNLLKEFQDGVGYENYADGFGLSEYGDMSGLVAGWSDDPEFTGRLIPFAQATGGGSFYALCLPRRRSRRWRTAARRPHRCRRPARGRLR
ncbi:hypothetical protein OIA45_01705 [Streptomyces chartreusis]|uniref:hypothetical protein n=1 Tax=Streptomyces chartreusis TaxID=1969 RepID=UPI00386DD8D7|nr:hypothetical protein OIA45_01705 [Streptomyces chartreusis]